MNIGMHMITCVLITSLNHCSNTISDLHFTSLSAVSVPWFELHWGRWTAGSDCRTIVTAWALCRHVSARARRVCFWPRESDNVLTLNSETSGVPREPTDPGYASRLLSCHVGCFDGFWSYQGSEDTEQCNYHSCPFVFFGNLDAMTK